MRARVPALVALGISFVWNALAFAHGAAADPPGRNHAAHPRAGTASAVRTAGNTAAERPARVMLTYWSAPNADELDFARAMAARWNGSHADVFVDVEPIPASGSSEEVLLAAVVAKTTPDICANMLPSMMNRFVHAGAVLPLDRFTDFERVVRERSDRATLEFARSADGHVYQMPWKANPVMLAYNADTFAARGARVPRTYAEFMQAAERLTYAGSAGGRIDHWAMNPGTSVTWWWRMFDFYPLYVAAAHGHTLLDPAHRLADRAAAAAALQFFAGGFAHGYFPRAGPQPDLFLGGRVAMRMVGPWGIRYFERASVRRFRFGFAPLPVARSEAGLPYTFADQKNIAIFATTQHPAQAWEFVKYLTTRAADLTLLEMTNQIPLRHAVVRDPAFATFFAQHPRVATFARQSEHVVPLDDSPHIVQILDYVSQQYEASAMYGLIAPDVALNNTVDYLATIDRL